MSESSVGPDLRVQAAILGRVEKLLMKHGEDLGSLKGRMLVMEAIGVQFRAMSLTIEDLRVTVAGFKTQVRITWAFMFSLIVALIGVAISIFQTGSIP